MLNKKKFTRLSQLYNKSKYAVEDLKDQKGQKAFCVLTRFGIFIVYESRWESFVEANEDFKSKNATAYKGFDVLKKWTRYSKKQIV